MLLRIDDIVSGIGKKDKQKASEQPQQTQDDPDNVIYLNYIFIMIIFIG